MRIDLHTHSTASDGTVAPAGVVEAAADAGLDVLALTDHDSAAGWAEATARAAELELTLVPGMEISTRHEGAGVHLLGYLLDPTYPPLVEELDRVLAGREARLPGILAGLAGAGVVITEQEVLDQVGEAPAIGRPHVADVLVARGFAADRDDAFQTWLEPGRPGFVSRYATATADMIRLVVEAGGVAVIAHPWGRASRRVLDLAALEGLTSSGLTGLEVDHHDHTTSDRATLRSIAESLDLVVTGSSDYHGAGKVGHALGSETTAPEQYERLLAAADLNASGSGRQVPAVVGR